MIGLPTEEDEDVIGIGGLLLCVAQLFVMILSILPVERALKRTFDENGNRRSQPM
jgi:hypothetical protein